MSLPPMRPDGYPPVGLHRTTLPELEQRCVRQCSSPWDRKGLFVMLRHHLRVLAGVTGPITVWLGGGLISTSPTAEEDVMVLGLCPDRETLGKVLQHPVAVNLFSIDDAIVGSPFPMGATPLLPYGGLIDANLATPDELHIWHNTFSWLTEEKERGYVEVVL